MSKLEVYVRTNAATGNYDAKMAGGPVLRNGQNRWFDTTISTERRSVRQAIATIRRMFTELDGDGTGEPKLF